MKIEVVKNESDFSSFLLVWQLIMVIETTLTNVYKSWSTGRIRTGTNR